MIQANNEIEKLSGSKELVPRTLNIIKEYYDPSAPAPGYASYIMKLKGGDRFYDDNQWIGIACMDAYKREKKPAYLNQALMMYRYMMTGYDTVLQGGIYWQENKKVSKNTCSNGPGIILALQLYQATKEKGYLDTALLLYKWVNDQLKTPSGLYYDNIRIGNHKIGRAVFSYNTGTMLQSNVYLYEITKDKKYLKQAIAIADSALAYFHGNGSFRDDYWFNAVLLRAYQHLLQYHKDKKYIKAFQVCTDHALKNNRDALGLMGKDKTLDLVAQSGMLEILARLAYLEKTHQL
jgi:rhamnogalacturonyl hydrolase YesR